MFGFEINLKQFTIGDVLQFLTHIKKTGVLKVKGSVSGEVFVKEGLVIHASDGVDKGMEALLNLSFMELETGRFEIGTTSPEQTISEDLGKLTENVEKRRIEYEEIRQKLPPMNTVLAKSTRDLESAVALRRTDWQILALIDGKRTLGDVIVESKIGGYEATKTITWLKDKGLIYDPEEAVRVMEKLAAFLRIVFKDFGKNGLELFKQWGDVEKKNRRVVDSVDVNPETMSIQLLAELPANDIFDSIKDFKIYIENEGLKMYGKMLFRKKWQAFVKKVEGM
ncbi:DUF4388 domain-containing protein [candidate division WOR-3 bacterium]|nr:DUF4388 domain-containing protein [candidate division WOR-3 bacterium]